MQRTITSLCQVVSFCQKIQKHRTMAFSCGARSASKLKGKKLLEKHAIAPSAARLCYAERLANRPPPPLLLLLSLPRTQKESYSDAHSLLFARQRICQWLTTQLSFPDAALHDLLLHLSFSCF